ncbi:hypothetical protein EMIHUDRAFT_232231 [Emiliania huxleyi CCMP1516]|uniref:Uncharacterized protein n=2 Tax=Emiliania huxleyi TaxID=2903 RepID=A0A0D3K682_EMIH1|nr:hypothetical protein EMIHUDRAFT_232231 [Emiliania huxleyi CCMP1516]EOD31267.1 hypothetical protein EMIHUDRAFT_232231 [Emiliania huxleyi CCMP1516]|eukprot:XP_005783696.1 hypothetical protein EMIHUDRAFT_232231 [Emiliania huxleyi CCMP1516]
MDELSEYELQRLEHIRRNHEMLVRLGLVDPTPAAPQQKAPRKPRTKLPPVPPESLRRSSRVRDLKPEYTKETIDQFGDDLDRQAARRSPAKKRPRPEEEDADEAALRREIDASTVAFLTEAREAMSRYLTSADGAAPATADAWREEAPPYKFARVPPPASAL